MPDKSFPGTFAAPGQPIDELALAEIKGAILAKLRLAIGKDAGMATRHDWYKAAALALESSVALDRVDVGKLQARLRAKGADPGDRPASNATFLKAAE